MRKLFALLVLIAVFFGCVTVPPQQPPIQPPDQNNSGQPPILDQNALDPLNDLNGLGLGSNPISVNLDTNTIHLQFDFDLNATDLDLNVLANACKSTCNVIDANKWSVKKDINASFFFCECTKISCQDEETPTQIIRYCRDDKIGLRFETEEEN